MCGSYQVPYSDYDIVEKEHLIISSRKEKDNAIFRVIAEEPPAKCYGCTTND